MGARENGIDDAQASSHPDALRRQALAGLHLAVTRRRMLEGTHNGRADGDNPDYSNTPLGQQ